MIKKLLPIAFAAALVAGSAHASNFVNGGFESGDLTGWSQGGGTWNGSPVAPVPASTYAGGTSNNSVVTGGVDPFTGLSRVFGGTHSAQVNDSRNDYSVSTLTQTVKNYTDNDIFFSWQAVLEGSHGLTDSDYFSLTLHDDTDNVDLVSRAYSSAGDLGGGAVGVTWKDYLGNGWFSAGWVIEHIDVAALNALGHDFTLTLLASDCPYGGHAGYAYLDGFGSVTPPVGTPEPGSLALLGAGLIGLVASRRRKTA